MYDMIIRAGRLGNGQLVDVAIKHGKIAALGSLPESTEAKQTLTLGGQVHVSAGWICNQSPRMKNPGAPENKWDLVGETQTGHVLQVNLGQARAKM